MLEPADLLLLDEPTNDLDIPTLEVLEESLLEFPGALVLVTHDRYLLDRVSTRLLALDGRGGAVPYADYDQWEAGQRRRQRPRPSPEAGASSCEPRRSAGRGQAEAARLPRAARVGRDGGAHPRRRGRLEAASRAAATRRSPPTTQALHERIEALAAAQAEVDRLYARWAELEGKVKA